VALSACCLLALYCVPTFVYAVATVALWAGAVAVLRRDRLQGRDRRVLIRLAVAVGAAVGVAVLLYIPTFGQSGWDYANAMGRASGPLWRIAERVWDHWSRATPNPLVWTIAAAFLASLVLHRRLARHPVPLAAPALAVFLVAVAARKAGPFERTWLYALPLYLIHAGAGLSHLVDSAVPRRAALASGAAAVAVAVVLAASAVDYGETDPTQLPSTDTHIVAFLKRELRPGEPALLDPANVGPASLYYLARDGYAPPGLPRNGPPTTALVVVRRREGRARVAGAVAESGRRLAPGPPPRLVRRLELVEAWEARIRQR
jgi:hypothetical protein